MIPWTLLEYAAWAISAALMLWMAADAARVARRYSEDVLLSSEEGHDELVRPDEQRQPGDSA